MPKHLSLHKLRLMRWSSAAVVLLVLNIRVAHAAPNLDQALTELAGEIASRVAKDGSVALGTFEGPAGSGTNSEIAKLLKGKLGDKKVALGGGAGVQLQVRGSYSFDEATREGAIETELIDRLGKPVGRLVKPFVAREAEVGLLRGPARAASTQTATPPSVKEGGKETPGGTKAPPAPSVAGTPTAPRPPAGAGSPPEAPSGKLEVIKERYPDGAVAVERSVVQDAKGNYVNHGPWTMFYPDGKKIGGGEFVNGKRHGKWTRWFAPGEGSLFAGPLYAEYEGPFLSEATFIDGKLHGHWIILDARKQKVSDWEFAGGTQQGAWIWWYASGQKRREAVYRNGQMEGEVLVWTPDGKVTKEQYIGGRRRFNRFWWHPGGQSWIEGWYLSGPVAETASSYDWWTGNVGPWAPAAGPDEPHGRWTWWYPSGQKETEGKYLFGKPAGPWTWWHPNGQKAMEGEFHDGKEAGKWTWWQPDGRMQRVQDFPRPATAGGEKTPQGGAPKPAPAPMGAASPAKPPG